MRAHRSVRGFGKVELALLVILIGVVITLAVPQARLSRLTSNEAGAATTLLAVSYAQESFRGEAVVDQDADTQGEYGLLGELAGHLIPRAAEKAVDPAYITPLIATGGATGTDGSALLKGYVYRVYLASAVTEEGAVKVGDDKTLGGTASTPGPTLTAVDPIDLQEKQYVLYAWPLSADGTGRLAYVVTSEPRIYATQMKAKVYSGRGPLGAANTPAVGAAFAGDPFKDKLDTGDHVGADGNTWFPTEHVRR